MFDEVGALLAGAVGYVDRGPFAGFDARLEHGIVFGVEGVTWVCVVVRARRNFRVVQKPSRASSINAMSSSRSNTVVPLSYDLLVLDDDGAYAPT